jgi:hypothetical protein
MARLALGFVFDLPDGLAHQLVDLAANLVV